MNKRSREKIPESGGNQIFIKEFQARRYVRVGYDECSKNAQNGADEISSIKIFFTRGKWGGLIKLQQNFSLLATLKNIFWMHTCKHLSRRSRGMIRDKFCRKKVESCEKGWRISMWGINKLINIDWRGEELRRGKRQRVIMLYREMSFVWESVGHWDVLGNK